LINSICYSSQVVGAADDGFLLRFDYIEDEILEKWAAWRKKT
jgi:hypothetical protein